MATKRKKSEDQFTLGLFGNPIVDIYKKPVQASQMIVRNGVMTGQQLKAWNVLLKNAKEQNDLYLATKEFAANPSPKTFRIPRVKLMEQMGYHNTNRKPFKEALVKMQSLKATWDVLRQDGNNLWASCVLLPFVSIDNEFVHYSFVDHIQPMLFESAIYSKLDLEMQRNLKLDPAIRLYDWVSRYRTNPGHLTSKEDWAFWRMVVHGEISADNYLHEYKLFKRDKLVPAIKEINEATDLMIELIEDREGTRRIQKLQFKVFEKPKFPVKDSNNNSGTKKIDIKGELTELGISNHYYKKLTSAFDDATILANLDYLKARLSETTKDTIRNKGAYLVAACESNYAGTQAARKEVTQTDPTTSVSTIMSQLLKKRNDDAMGMYAEMSAVEQADIVEKYNNQVTVEEALIPADYSKRQNRHMIPFYSWLADHTWGQPTSEEVIEFTLHMNQK